MQKEKNNEQIGLKKNIFQDMIEYSNDLIWVLDPEGMITYINKKAEDTGGFKSADIVGKHFSLLIPPEDLPRIQNIVNETLAGKAQTYEAVINLSKKRKLFLLVNAAPVIESNKITGVVSFACDITDRVKAEETFTKSAEEWHNTFDAILDCVMVLDNNNIIIKANRAFLEFIGSEKDNVIGQKCYKLLHGTDSPLADCPFERTKIDNKFHSFELDDPVKQINLMISISPLFNERSELAGAVHIIRDISELTKAKKILEKKISDLEVFVKTSIGREIKMIELKKKLRELEDKLKEKNGN